MTLDLIETLKTLIYSPKHTNDTKIHVIFQNDQNLEIHI